MAYKLTPSNIRLVDNFRDDHPTEYEELRNIMTAGYQVSNEVKQKIAASTGIKVNTIRALSSFIGKRLGVARPRRRPVAQLNNDPCIQPLAPDDHFDGPEERIPRVDIEEMKKAVDVLKAANQVRARWVLKRAESMAITELQTGGELPVAAEFPGSTELYMALDFRTACNILKDAGFAASADLLEIATHIELSKLIKDPFLLWDSDFITDAPPGPIFRSWEHACIEDRRKRCHTGDTGTGQQPVKKQIETNQDRETGVSRLIRLVGKMKETLGKMTREELDEIAGGTGIDCEELMKALKM